jgi:hypothetical protein
VDALLNERGEARRFLFEQHPFTLCHWCFQSTYTVLAIDPSGTGESEQREEPSAIGISER